MIRLGRWIKNILSLVIHRKIELKNLFISQRNSYCRGEGNSVFVQSVCLSSHQQFICDVLFTGEIIEPLRDKSNKYAMTRNWSNQNPNPALKIQRGNN